MLHLTAFQRKLCNVLQEGLPICWRPFAEIATALPSDEGEILRQTSYLKQLGVIRRIGARINLRVLGITSTLVAAHVPPDIAKQVVEAINSLEDVSHNYQRNHYYNLWFTLRAPTASQIEMTLAELSGRFTVDFHSLKAVRVFKLNARFDAESEGRELLQGCQKIPQAQPFDFAQGEPVVMNEDYKKVLSGLQDALEIIAEPFAFLCRQGLQKEDVLRIITELMDKGVIRRIAAVVDHHKLGFVANVLFVCEVLQDRIVQTGEKLAALPLVSHCYERQTFEGWPFNLFGMMHGQSMDQIQHAINKFTEAEGIHSFELLPTVAEFKRQSVKHTFE